MEKTIIKIICQTRMKTNHIIKKDGIDIFAVPNTNKEVFLLIFNRSLIEKLFNFNFYSTIEEDSAIEEFKKIFEQNFDLYFSLEYPEIPGFLEPVGRIKLWSATDDKKGISVTITAGIKWSLSISQMSAFERVASKEGFYRGLMKELKVSGKAPPFLPIENALIIKKIETMAEKKGKVDFE